MSQTVSTKLEWIAETAKVNSSFKYQSLAHHMGVDFLEVAYHKLKKDKAPGVDGQTVREYGEGLRDNLATLHERLKTNRYRATPVKRVMIPKGKDGQRPLGLPVVEDKIVQMAVKMMLEPIYEQDFLNCSYGVSSWQELSSSSIGSKRKLYVGNEVDNRCGHKQVF